MRRLYGQQRTRGGKEGDNGESGYSGYTDTGGQAGARRATIESAGAEVIRITEGGRRATKVEAYAEAIRITEDQRGDGGDNRESGRSGYRDNGGAAEERAQRLQG